MIQLNNKVTAELETAPNVWSNLGGAFKSVSQSLGESVYTASYLADDGFSSSYVTGINYVVTFQGDYVSGDPVINFIFSNNVLHGTGGDRITRLRITRDNKIVVWQVAMTKIQESGGGANEPDSVALELQGLGKPTFTSA